jgi:hypothetical protein
MVGAIRQLHLIDARLGQPAAVGFRQEVDHRATLSFSSNGTAPLSGSAAVERGRHLEQVVLHFHRLRPLRRARWTRHRRGRAAVANKRQTQDQGWQNAGLTVIGIHRMQYV